ncbi:MAG: ABC transporter permease [Acholeplasmatales bacterium]|nr:ABC transporter permease [Acholeplasmatales bacterium]
MYIVKRLLMAILTIFVVITVTFFVMQAVPGGPFLSEKGITEARLAALNKRYGLDQPLVVQWLRYVVNALRFDFGVSIKDNDASVMSLIWNDFKVSAVNGLLASVLAIVVGIFLGVIAAVKRGKIADRIIMILSTAMVAVPSFVIAAFFLYWFCVKLKAFPTNFGTSSSALKYFLPVLTLSLYPMSYIVRLTRTSTLDVLNSDYVRTARAKGVSPFKVLFKHTLRNSLTPVITYAGPMVAFILTGSLVVEKLFSIPGLGGTLIVAIQRSNYPMVMGCTVFVSYIVIFFILVSDILYKVVNPRVDLE